MSMVYHEDFLQITQTQGHPECPERLASIMSYLDLNELEIENLAFEPASEDDLLAVHTQELIDYLKHFDPGTMVQEPFADTFYHAHTFEMARLAAGGGLAAANHAYEKREPGFALLRPPGHHATQSLSGGFCYLNNIAIAAASLLKKVEKVAIVDVDVHHGNGTNDIFLGTDKVLFFSTHQWGIYPGTGPAEQVGEGEGEGFNVNVPLFSRSGDVTFLEAYGKIAAPILEQYKPDMILVSLGLDAHYLDPLASLTLSSSGYLDILEMLKEKAEKLCEGRIAFFLEGGYNLHALADVVVSAIARFHGQPLETRLNEVFDGDGIGIERVEHALAIQKKYWDLNG